METTEKKARRRVIVRVSATALVGGWQDMAQPGLFLRCETPLPKDTRVLGCIVDQYDPTSVLIGLESGEFAEVEPGSMPPTLELRFRRDTFAEVIARNAEERQAAIDAKNARPVGGDASR